jgi:predicted ester cyclase
MRSIQRSLLYDWFDSVWNNNDKQSINRLMKPDAVFHGLSSDPSLSGVEGFNIFVDQFRNAFDNIQIEIADVIAQDDMEAGRTNVSATHKQTGRQVRFSGLCFVRVEKGQIAEAWNEYNFLAMHSQLGQELTPVATV